ncbi:MAG: UDP-N-acetylglucosamine 1-carboxyvinyltransferase, partial [Candidatus Taylorbacteria bacterium]
MMAAVMGNRVVTLHNCAKEPEIVNVATWLNQCGANISGVGTETITIVGTKGKLLSPKTIYTAIPDRIEAGSYLILGALCSSELTINECRPDHMKSVISLLKTSGVHITISKYANSNGNRSIFITDNGKPNSDFHSFNVQTSVYPGFPTDLQAQIVTYLTQVTGASTVKENIFEGRLKYVVDLTKLGANILIKNPNEISIQGPTKLLAAIDDHELNAHDIRAGFAMIMAAIISTGTYVINNTYFVDRGYEKIEERLTLLGAKIDRVQSV